MQSEKTRRNLVFGNLKAIGKIAVTAAAASALTSLPAKAFVLACFPRGTKIRTVAGERNVEDLKVGDMLPTMFGGERPIRWIAEWHRQKRKPGQAWQKYNQLVRIMRSALAQDAPHTDLYVTQGHALFIDGVLIPAGALVNGTTIALCPAVEQDEQRVFNVKLNTHDVIYAEGAPCETLARVDETAKNYAEYERLYGVDTAAIIHCAPIFCNGAGAEIRSRIASLMSPWCGLHKVDIIRDHLRERAEALVWA